MNRCERYELLISLAVDGEATAEERAELEHHLASCPDCRACYEDIQRIHQTFVREDAAVPEGFSRRLMDRVRETAQDPVREERKSVLFPHWRRWWALAVCCALAALCMWGVWGGKDGAVVAADGVLETEGMDMRSMDSEPVLQAVQSAGTDGTEGADAGVVTVTTTSLDRDAPQSVEYDAVKSTSEGDGGDGQPQRDIRIASTPTLTAGAVPEAVEEPEEAIDGADGAEDSSEDIAVADAEKAPDDPAENADLAGEAEEPAETAVPEPGILTAFGSAAQSWVENVLGLPWASGGSYPLTAEQYAGLLRALDEAGEPYRVEPGDCYCLMTE